MSPVAAQGFLYRLHLNTSCHTHWLSASLGKDSLHGKVALVPLRQTTKELQLSAYFLVHVGEGSLKSVDVRTVCSTSSLVPNTGHVQTDRKAYPAEAEHPSRQKHCASEPALIKLVLPLESQDVQFPCVHY